MRRYLTGLTLVGFTLIALLALPASRALAVNSRASMASILPQSKMTDVTLSEAIDFIRDASGANVSVDWTAIAAAGISKDALVNLNLRNVAAGKLLSLILSQVAPGGKLTYYVADNVVEITTQDEADKKIVTEVYYVDDIVTANDQFDPTINISTSIGNALGGTGGSAGGAGGSGGSFGGSSYGGSQAMGSNGSNSGNSNTNIYSATYRQQKAKDLIKMIETVIRPEIWKDNGGTATMEYYNGHLIITAPRLVQEAIGGPIK